MVKLLRKRYMGFKVTSERILSRHDVLSIILEELQSLNRYETDPIRVRLLEYWREGGVGILLCDHKSVNKILSLLDRVNDKNRGVVLKSYGVSGSLRALNRRFPTK